MPFQVCPQHSDEEIVGRALQDPPGSFEYVCSRSGHVRGGSYAWIEVPEPPGSGLSDVAHQYRLDVELPAALAGLGGSWYEYGVLEAAYAGRCPEDFAALVAEYGHTAQKAKQYTVSAFLARTLGELARQGVVAYHAGPATGRWSYNSEVSWWASPPGPEWGTDQVSWESLGRSMDHVPGSTE
jgi:hypothetical protein